MYKKWKLSPFKLNLDRVDAMISRNRGRPLIRYFVMLCRVLGGSLRRNWVRVVYLLVIRLSAVHRHQGVPGLVKFLKVASVSLQQHLGGHFERDLTSLGPRVSRTRDGIPRILPSGVRKAIRNGSIFYIRLSLTIFALYRILVYTGSLKTKTITDPYSGTVQAINRVKAFIPRFSKLFMNSDKPFDIKLGPADPFPIYTSSPNAFASEGEYASHPTSLACSWRAIVELNILPLIAAFSLYMKYSPLLQEFCSRIARDYEYRTDSTIFDSARPRRWKSAGKLGLKEEAAGKVRVFAMVDPFTQYVMRPLHRALFNRLEKIPMDGTFDQMRPLSRVPFGKGSINSYDLSAATDRLPISLQKAILRHLFDEKFAHLWAQLLVGRHYFCPSPKPGMRLRYSVGQPMGALSSWAMLAVTHHLIVQAAAWSSGHSRAKLFTSYAVLGDDIVIWDQATSVKYLEIITQLGVEVGLAKSILSPLGSALEFAKRTMVRNENVSPISLRELSAALQKGTAFLGFVRKYSVPRTVSLRLLGVGYRSKGNNHTTRLFDLLDSIPSNALSTAKIFKVSFILDKLFQPRNVYEYTDDVSRLVLMLQFLRKELGRQENRVKALQYLLLQVFSGTRLNSYVRLHSNMARKYIGTLYYTVENIRGTLNRINEIYDTITIPKQLFIPLSGYPEGVTVGIPYKYNPQPDLRYILPAFHVLYETEKLLSEIDSHRMIDPCWNWEESSSKDVSDERRTQRLWGRWIKILERVIDVSQEQPEKQRPNPSMLKGFLFPIPMRWPRFAWPAVRYLSSIRWWSRWRAVSIARALQARVAIPTGIRFSIGFLIQFLLWETFVTGLLYGSGLLIGWVAIQAIAYIKSLCLLPLIAYGVPSAAVEWSSSALSSTIKSSLLASDIVLFYSIAVLPWFLTMWLDQISVVYALADTWVETFGTVISAAFMLTLYPVFHQVWLIKSAALQFAVTGLIPGLGGPFFELYYYFINLWSEAWFLTTNPTIPIDLLLEVGRWLDDDGSSGSSTPGSETTVTPFSGTAGVLPESIPLPSSPVLEYDDALGMEGEVLEYWWVELYPSPQYLSPWPLLLPVMMTTWSVVSIGLAVKVAISISHW